MNVLRAARRFVVVSFRQIVADRSTLTGQHLADYVGR